jgi:hypothetical protein
VSSNTLIIPFRHAAHIPLCLTSLEVCGDIDQHQILLAQHGGPMCEFGRDDLNLCHWYICDQEPFHLSKLLNGAIKRARTEWVTVLQPDVLVPFNFIATLETLQAEASSDRFYFPVRYLDSDTTQSVESRFNLFYERVIPSKSGWKRASETYGRFLIGSDCFTVRTSSYVELGGYDERFHDRALAGIDFGIRWLNANPPPACVDCHLFHRWCRTGSFEENPATEARERELFAEKQRDAFPPLSITREWGVFQRADA